MHQWWLVALCHLCHLSATQVLTPSQVTISYNKPITATSTCGEVNGRPITEIYCSLAGSSQYNPFNQYSYSDSSLSSPGALQELRSPRELFIQGGHGCGHCQAESENAHPAAFMVDGNTSWWQSPPLSRGMQYNQVNITIDLLQEFHVAYVWIQMANSPKPGTWILEKSIDYGKTYEPWYYFAENDAECFRRFGVESLAPIDSDEKVICRSDFASIQPLENGEMMINLMESRPSRDSFMSSTSLQNFTRATNVRLRLLGTRTLQGHLMDLNEKTDPTVTRRYFYAIKEILMGGRCVCNGHAKTCDIINPHRPKTLLCRCEHNTCGDMCEQCCPGFVAKKWQRTTATNNFTCEPCNCFNRASGCEYDEELDRLGLSLDIHGRYEGGGRCIDCRAYTEGINCNQCVSGFYRPEDRQWNHTEPCIQCRCDPSKHSGKCAEGTGKCECQARFTGENCDQCARGYHSPPECLPCECSVNGTVGDVCTPANGICPCREGFGGVLCDSCADGFTNISAGCVECGCHEIGAVHNNCSALTGTCICQAKFAGEKCDKCANGHFNFPQCKYCNCDPSGTENGICDASSGQCLCRVGFAGTQCQECDIGYFGYPNCRPCACNVQGSNQTECDQKTGDCKCFANFTGRTCDRCAAGFFDFPRCRECACLIEGAKGLTCDQKGQCFCKGNFEGEHCDRCKPNFYNFPTCEECNCNPAGVTIDFGGCDKVAPGELCSCRRNVQGRICDECKPTFWDLQQHHREGCIECKCNLPGTLSRLNTCLQQSGQCLCKKNVAGRACDRCAAGYYNMQSHDQHGCQPCLCDVGGALKGDCDANTGQCRCRPRVGGLRCDRPIENHFYPNLWHHKYEAEDGRSPDNRPVRFAIDNELFPGFSWRGFAVFSPIQEEIIIDLDITKASVYRLLFKVHNTLNVTMNAVVTLHTGTHDVKQSEKASFPPSKEPYVTEITTPGKPLLLNPGRWELHVNTKQRLFLDFVVLIPSEYYDGTSLIGEHVVACQPHHIANVSQYNSTHSNETCIDLLYPPLNPIARTDNVLTVPFVQVNEDGQEENLEMMPVEQLPAIVGPAAFVRAGTNSRTIKTTIEVPLEDDYVLLLEYHNKEKSDQRLLIDVEQDGSKTSGVSVIHHCPYTTFCREVVTDRGQPAFVHLKQGVVTVSMKVDPMHEFGLAAINLVRKSNWNEKLLQQVPVCIRKDGICQPLVFPQAASSVTAEAETGQQEGVAVKGDALTFDIANADSVTVVPLDENKPTLEIFGVVPDPNHYMLMVNYFNPDNTPIDVETLVTSGSDQFLEAVTPFVYCPSVGGCRVLIREKAGVGERIQFNLDDKYSIQFMRNDSQKGPIYIDSITAVPYQAFDGKLLHPQPHDLSGDFVQDCTSDYLHPDEVKSEFCKSQIFSLTTHFNSATFPCECSSQGSTSFTCAEYGGQCECKPNVIGRRCDRCASGHYGFPECKKCECGSTQQCDERTGQCFCPQHVEGKNCDQCVSYAFGFDPLIGCQKCGCNPQGSAGGRLMCDPNSGQCLCKESVGGRQCDRCLAGFYGFPYCHKCMCNLDGTTADVCDGQTAQCMCKENVVGQDCSHCKQGTFSLARENEKGCINCFCFGVTDFCSSSLLPVSVRSIDMSLVKTTDEEGTLTVDENDYVVYEGKGDPKNAVYFEIPVVRGRDYTTSHGLSIFFQLSAHPLGENREKTVVADVILEGRNLTAQYWADEQPADPTNRFLVQVKLNGDLFLDANMKPFERDDFMMLLHSLSSIKIKLSYFEQTKTAKLMEFGMEEVDESASDAAIRATTVEKCNCPAPYTGLSCQKCAPGHYRVKSGKYLGSCVPCNCNSHSGTCDPDTGICSDCQHNTVGPHCELCVEGHYGDATTGSPYACLACQCPFAPDNNFATSCEVSNDGAQLSCTCKEGYEGPRCEECEAGYFGQPMESGGTCQRCECNGNNDLRDPQACHPNTGDCYLCQNNTAGRYCEHCAQWFHGDAVKAKDCKECECDKCGSEWCDHQTGICSCRPNIEGERCDRCKADHFGFSKCQGCLPCHCGVASSTTQCDDSGQCTCRPGAAGLRCEYCEHGYWNYGEGGCTKCDCEADLSMGTVCDVYTGQCHCQEGATGPRCDQCLPSYLRIPTFGCKRCDECVHHLKRDVDALDGRIGVLSTTIGNISAATIDGARLARSSKKLAQLNETKHFIDNLQTSDTSILARGRSILEDGEAVRLGTESLQKISNDNKKKANDVVEDAKNLGFDIHERAELANLAVTMMENLAESIGSHGVALKARPEWIEEAKMTLKLIEERGKNISSFEAANKIEIPKNLAEKEKAKMMELKDQLKNYTKREEQHRKFIEEQRVIIQKALNDANAVEKRVKNNKIAKVEAIKQSINDDSERVQEDFDKIEETIASARDETAAAKAHGEEIQKQIQEITERREKVDARRKKRQTEDLNAKRNEVMTKSFELERDANQLNNTFGATRQAAKHAVQAANVYEQLKETLQSARGNGTKANEIVEGEQETISQLKENVADSVNKSEGLLAIARDTYGAQQQEMQTELNSLEVRTNELRKNIENMNKAHKQIEMQGFNETLKEKLAEINARTELDDASKKTEKVNELEKKAHEKIDGALESRAAVKQAKQNLKEINERQAALPKEWKEMSERVRNQTMRFERVSEKINKLKEALAIAREAAEKVNLPVRVNRGSSVDVNVQQPLTHSSIATDLSLFVRTRQPNGTPIFFGNVVGSSGNRAVPTDDYVMIQVEQGRPTLTIQLGDQPLRTALGTRIDNGEWHRLGMRRVGRSVTFTLYVGDTTRVMEETTATAPGNHAVLNLHNSISKMYVGGVPSNVRVLTPDPSFIGDISDVVLNGENIGLWSVNADGLVRVSGADRHRRTESPFEREVGLSGGFLTFKMGFWNPRTRTELRLSFLTYAPDALLFYVGKDRADFMSLELSSGVVRLMIDFGSGVGSFSTEQAYNDGQWHSVTLTREGKSIRLQVDNETQTGEMPGEMTEMRVSDYFYLGGVPLEVPIRNPFEPLKGCLKKVKLSSDTLNLHAAHRSKGVTQSCPISLTREVAFLSGRSTAEFANVSLPQSVRPTLELSFQFKTNEANGTIATLKNIEDESIVLVKLVNGELFVSGSEGDSLPLGITTANDGFWHYISIYGEGSNVKAAIDDSYFVDLVNVNLDIEPYERFTLTFGKPYNGCVRDVTFGGAILEFSKSENREIRLTGCSMKEISVPTKDEETTETEETPDTTTVATTTTAPRKKNKKADNQTEIESVKEKRSNNNKFPQTCALGVTPGVLDENDQGWRFGLESFSRVEYASAPDAFDKSGTLTLWIRPEASSGVILYAANKLVTDHFGLFFVDGKVLFTFNTGSGTVKIASTIPIIDREWHFVKASRKGNYGQLTVDDEVVEGTGSQSTDSIDFDFPVYVGGLNNDTVQNLKAHGLAFIRPEISGCIKDLRINDKPFVNESLVFGTTPCAEAKEKGLFLGEEGGYAIINNPEPLVTLSVDLKIRSRVDSGLIFSVGKVEYIGLELVNGNITVTMKSREGGTVGINYGLPTNTSICDGHWHSVKVFRKKNLITMVVDGKSSMKIGKKSGNEFTLKDPIVFGKPPEGMVNEQLLSKPTFVGCIRLKYNAKETKRMRREDSDHHDFDNLEDVQTYGDSHTGCPAN